MPSQANGHRIYALADYTVERTGKGWYFGRTSRFGDVHATEGSLFERAQRRAHDRARTSQ